ncbi:hypothetical protein LCGC14_0225160 [marine sediment metagenome]|uniref:Uncharacterized protein n=1 Tax=marine sediment metagenome TaxID=412755 RepID=A0A0F9UTY3_9ZZZZ
MSEESKIVKLEEKVEKLKNIMKSLLRIADASIDFKTFSGLSKVLKEDFCNNNTDIVIPSECTPKVIQCPDCNSDTNVQYLGGKGAYTCTNCNSHFYTEKQNDDEFEVCNDDKCGIANLKTTVSGSHSIGLAAHSLRIRNNESNIHEILDILTRICHQIKLGKPLNTWNVIWDTFKTEIFKLELSMNKEEGVKDIG